MNELEAYEAIISNFNFTLVDLGGRNGLVKPWNKVQSIITSIIFDPDESIEDNEKNRANTKGKTILIPKIVGGKEEIRDFNITRNLSYCSLLEPNNKELEGTYYYERNFYKVDKKIKVNVHPLSYFLNENKVEKVDFLKIDIQGSESIVLKNIPTLLDNILGIFSEAYAAKLYKDGDTIADILQILYYHDLEIHDIKVIANSVITNSNKENIFSKENLSARPISGYKCRPMVFDLLCIKNRLKIIESMDEEKIRKSIFISSLYENYDIALDILIRSKDNKIFNNKDYNEIKSSIKFLHKNSLNFYTYYKELLLSRVFKLKLR